MSADREIDGMRSLLMQKMSAALQERFDAEARLYDALVENDIAKTRLNALEQAITSLKRSVR